MASATPRDLPQPPIESSDSCIERTNNTLFGSDEELQFTEDTIILYIAFDTVP